MAAIVRAVHTGTLKGIEPVVVISSRADAGGLEKARRLGIKTLVISPRQFADRDAFGTALLKACHSARAELISKNGWLPLTPNSVVKGYAERIINQHPGPLDPGSGHDFGGKGMYGKRVLCARIAYSWLSGKDYWTEATTHIVTENYDEGHIIRAAKFSLPRNHFSESELSQQTRLLRTTTETLQAQLFPLEYKTVIATLQDLANGVTRTFTRKRRLIPPKKYAILDTVKQLAIKIFPYG